MVTVLFLLVIQKLEVVLDSVSTLTPKIQQADGYIFKTYPQLNNFFTTLVQVYPLSPEQIHNFLTGLLSSTFSPYSPFSVW
jgi:phage-related protein